MTVAPKSVPWRPLGETGVHFWRVQRMAKACGVNPAQAADQGDLPQEDWADLVHRCRSCQWAEGCDRWLCNHAGSTGEQPPAQCVNADIFKSLAEKQ